MVANTRPIFSVGDAVIYRGELARIEHVQRSECVIRELKSGWIVTVSYDDLTPAPGWVRGSAEAEGRPESSRVQNPQPATSRPAADSSSKNRDHPDERHPHSQPRSRPGPPGDPNLPV